MRQKPHHRIQDNAMTKAKRALIILGALALMANAANAQHRAGSQTHVRPLSRTSGYARRESPQSQSSGGLYDSVSQGHQSYPNPDRELYVNRSCC
jgi:hypothetical protein